MDISTTPAQAPKARLKINRFTCAVKTGELYGIYIGNFFLTILTVGFYRFWGRTRIRKYIASHIDLGGFPFEYTGTGKELFFGFLKFYGCMVLFGILVGIISGIFKAIGLGILAPVVVGVMFLLILPLISGVMYLAFRYFSSRISWKAIRFGLGGSIKEYMKIALVRWGWNIISLGYLLPKSQLILWQYKMNNTYYGQTEFDYRGDASRLMKTNLITLIIAFAVFIPGVVMLVMGQLLAKDHPEAAILILPGYLCLFMTRFVRLFYHAKLWEEELRGLRVGNLRFKSTATGMGFFKLALGNMAIMIFTLGLGYPITVARKIKFLMGNFIVAGELEEFHSLQAPKSASGLGDAAVHHLDLGGGFDLGM